MDFSPVRIGLMKNTAVLVKKVTTNLISFLAFQFIEGEAFICKGPNRTKYPVGKSMTQKICKSYLSVQATVPEM